MHRTTRLLLGWMFSAITAGTQVEAQIQGAVVQAPDGDSGLYGVSGTETICVYSPEPDEETCWPALGGRLSDLRVEGDRFLAAGYATSNGFTDLFLLRGGAGEIEVLPVPAGSGAPRGRPQIVLQGGRLAGLLWLEGAEQEELSLSSAQWLGTSWAEPVTVSPTWIGSQVAPAVTTLSDGRWLALWTAFDGEDDETIWSLFDGDGWSQRSRLGVDDPYPDITPRVIATRAGALATWSAFDGRDYRVRLARFDGEGWQPLNHSSGRGSTDPHLLTMDGLLLLSYSSVIPEEWVFAVLDPTGRELRRATVPSSNPNRPAIDWNGEISVRWHDRSEESTTAVWEAGR